MSSFRKIIDSNTGSRHQEVSSQSLVAKKFYREEVREERDAGTLPSFPTGFLRV